MINIHMYTHVNQFEGFFVEPDKIDVYYWWDNNYNKEYEFIGRFTLDGMFLKEIFIMSRTEAIVGYIVDD